MEHLSGFWIDQDLHCGGGKGSVLYQQMSGLFLWYFLLKLWGNACVAGKTSACAVSA